MAKSRAQRKAERRKREAAQARQGTEARAEESKAQHDTQVPESADVLEAKLAEEGASLDQVSALKAEPAEPEAPAPSRADAPAPSRADTPEPEAGDKISRRARKQEEREARQKAKESEERRRPKDEPVERQRGRVMGFLASCVAELRRVQWPDRETLIQASAVTVLFIAIAAAYLGALDAVFGQVVQLIL